MESFFQPNRSRVSAEEAVQVDPRIEDALPQVALLGQALGHVQNIELVGYTSSSSSHTQRRRHPGPLDRARRVDRRQRRRTPIHVVVEEDLAAPSLDRPVHGHHVAVRRQHLPRERLGNCAYGVIVHRARDRHVQVQTGLAGRLEERVQADPFEQLPVPARDVAGAGKPFRG